MTSTFAPPTGPPVTGAPGATPPEIEPAPVASGANGRRRPVALVVAVVAAVALGVAGFVALTAGRSVDVAEPYSLLAAAESTIAARTVEFDLTVSAAELADVTVQGAVDNESDILSVTADLSSLLSLGDTPLPLGGGDVMMLVDGSNGVVYLDASALGGFLPTGAAWVSVDAGALAEQSGQPLDDLQDQFVLDPTDVAHTLLDSENATEVGTDMIDGVETRHYQVSVDLAEALAAVPQADLDTALGDVALPDTVTYDVWVTADNQLRRVAFETDIAGQSIAMVLDMTATDDASGLELPDDSEVVDLTGLLGL